MIAFLAGLALVAALILAVTTLRGAEPAKLARNLKRVAAVAVGLVALGLLITGRLFFASLAATLALSLAGLREADAKAPFASWGVPRHGAAGELASGQVVLTLALDAPGLQVHMLTGPWAGTRFADLDQDQVFASLDQVALSDPLGAGLITLWLDHHAPAWREDFQRRRYRAPPSGQAPESALDRGAARRLLGLGGQDSAEVAQASYRRLMRLYHPDRGGSDRLAALINRAKDLSEA